MHLENTETCEIGYIFTEVENKKGKSKIDEKLKIGTQVQYEFYLHVYLQECPRPLLILYFFYKRINHS